LLRRVLCIGLCLCAAALVAFAIVADREWYLRHVVVPAYYLPPSEWTLPALRLFAAAFAAVVAACGVLALRRGTPGGIARIGLALALSVCAAEVILRAVERPELETPNPRLEWRLGVADARTGWAFVPRRSAEVTTPGSGRVTRYDVDARGNRAPSIDFVEQPDAPTLVVAGESIAAGHGLPWKDTFAARLGETLRLQVVNVAEGGYGTDQAYLRARDALGRLQKPVALVMTVLPVQLHRNLQDDRSHLVLRDGALELAPAAASSLRLREMFVNRLPYLSDARLAESLALTRAILEAAEREARERGARPLFVAVGYDASRPEAFAMEPLLAGLPHVAVTLAPERILPWDGHPDAAGAQQIADAAASFLR
jgi:hypothetical protein